MQNSIWKLTALAGVVGVGLLIVMQAQNGIKPDANENKVVKSESDDDKKTLDKKNDVDWQANDQQEPEVDGRKVIGPMDVNELDKLTGHSHDTKTQIKDSFFTGEIDDDTDNKTAGLFESDSLDRELAAQPELKRLPNSNLEFSLGQASPSDAVFESFDDAKPANARTLPATAPTALVQDSSAYTEFANEDRTDAAATDNSAEPKLLSLDDTDDGPFFSAQPADRSAKGQQLLLDARRAMQSGDLKTARSLALEADGLKSNYGALDDRPDLVLREVDALLAKQSTSEKPIFDEAGKIRENESGIIPVAGVVFDEADTKKTSEEKDPFSPSSDDNTLKLDDGDGKITISDPKIESEPSLLDRNLDDSPFDSNNSGDPVQLLPDNPPKLLADPPKLFQSESTEKSTAGEPTIESPQLDEPFDPSSDSLGPLIDSPAANTPKQLPTTIDDGPFGNESPALENPRPDLSIGANPINQEPLGIDQIDISNQLIDPQAIPNVSLDEPSKSTAITRVKREPTSEKKEVRGSGVIPENDPGAEQRPELTIEKIAPPEATLGRAMIYSIVISNRGAAHAGKVTVEDIIPLGCKLVGTIPQAELVDSKLTWRLGRLESGKQKKIHVKVVPITEGEIGSVAKVNFVAEVAARTEVRQAPRASIRVTATAPNQARIGEAVKLHFKIQNTGQIDADNMTLQDMIPKGFEHPAGADLTYEIGMIKAGQSVDVDLELKAIKEGTFINRAIIKEDGVARTESKATIKIIDARGLSVQSLQTRPGIVGQRMIHSFKVSNPSTIMVTNAKVIARLPREVRFVKADAGGQYTAESHSISWDLAQLASNKSVTLSSTLLPTTFGAHTARLQVSHPNAPLTQIDSEIVAKGIAALAINLSNVPATADSGDEFTVDATITNRGTGPDSNVRFSLSLPSNIEFVSARGPVKNGIVQTSAGPKVIPFGVIPEIGEQASATFKVTLRARAAGRPKLRAEVSSQQLDDPVATEAAVVILEAP
jgi:uncharacterized repeat protein (TIGR01451 family)